jgi:nucleoside-diphosphate-sugar epimerase
VFGDGEQTRDFTWVEETAEGIAAATACDELVGQAVNIAYGSGVTISEVCDRLLEILDRTDLRPERAPERPGDVRHHYADTTKAREVLGFSARTAIGEGLPRYVDWVRTQSPDYLGDPQVVRNW